jgi:tetratricopeptide (TPR) repeat protein
MSARNDLGTLEASGLVQVATLEPELEYLFRHALVQDAAYSSLLKQDRRTLHRLAAETLLTLYPERRGELAAVIAMHFERAGDPAAAVEHFVVAGEHALERFANREALAFFDRAEAGLTDDDRRIDLRLRAALGGAKVSWTFGSIDGPTTRLERALGYGEDGADLKLVGDAYFWLAFLRRLRGERPDTSPKLKHAAERAAQIGRARGDPLADAIPNAFAGVGMMGTGQLREGARLLSESLPPIIEHGDPLSSAILSGLLAVMYARLGEFAAAERWLTDAERLAEGGDPIAALDAKISRSSLMVERGDIAEGEALASTCAARSEELGAMACGVASNVIAGMAHLARDDALGAKVPLERGDELAQVSNMEPFRTMAQGLLGSVRTQLGDTPGGLAAWTLALERAYAMHDRGGEALTLWQRARTRAHATPPDYEIALADIDAATKLMEEMEARPSLARALRLRSQILRATGRAAEADASDKRSKAIGAELGLKDFAASGEPAA